LQLLCLRAESTWGSEGHFQKLYRKLCVIFIICLRNWGPKSCSSQHSWWLSCLLDLVPLPDQPHGLHHCHCGTSKGIKHGVILFPFSMSSSCSSFLPILSPHSYICFPPFLLTPILDVPHLVCGLWPSGPYSLHIQGGVPSYVHVCSNVRTFTESLLLSFPEKSVLLHAYDLRIWLVSCGISPIGFLFTSFWRLGKTQVETLSSQFANFLNICECFCNGASGPLTVENHMSNSFIFADHLVSVTAARLCCCESTLYKI
jgi:hypothetical protein